MKAIIDTKEKTIQVIGEATIEELQEFKGYKVVEKKAAPYQYQFGATYIPPPYTQLAYPPYPTDLVTVNLPSFWNWADLENTPETTITTSH